jgi:hypothetical protein
MGFKPCVLETFALLRLSDKGVALTYIVATGFNPWATSPKYIMSAVGTMHIIWAVPTTLFIVFSFYTGLKPGATILFEPLALKNKETQIFRTRKVSNPSL